MTDTDRKPLTRSQMDRKFFYTTTDTDDKAYATADTDRLLFGH